MKPMCMPYLRPLFYNFKRSVTQLGYTYIYYNLTQKKIGKYFALLGIYVSLPVHPVFLDECVESIQFLLGRRFLPQA